MPCTMPYPELEANEEARRVRGLLCEAMALIPADAPMSRDLREWWEDHQEEDRIRREREDERRELKKLAERAVAKLTTEEVEALRHAGVIPNVMRKEYRSFRDG